MSTIFILSFIGHSLWATPQELRSLKTTVIQADLASDRKEQKRLAKEALEIAEKCLQDQPQVACYYYRAQATGIYYGRSFFGYVRRVREMLKDWETALKLDPTFDYGGPYRMMAEVYTELPSHFGPKDLRRDLPKAIDYLKKAIAISDYPTNTLDLAEALLKLNRQEEAMQAIGIVDKILPQWKFYPYYSSWLNTLQNLKK